LYSCTGAGAGSGAGAGAAVCSMGPGSAGFFEQLTNVKLNSSTTARVNIRPFLPGITVHLLEIVIN
jgi:hypothetical protein